MPWSKLAELPLVVEACEYERLHAILAHESSASRRTCGSSASVETGSARTPRPPRGRPRAARGPASAAAHGRVDAGRGRAMRAMHWARRRARDPATDDAARRSRAALHGDGDARLRLLLSHRSEREVGARRDACCSSGASVSALTADARRFDAKRESRCGRARSATSVTGPGREMALRLWEARLDIHRRSELGGRHRPTWVEDEVRSASRCARDRGGRSCAHENHSHLLQPRRDCGRGPDEALRRRDGCRRSVVHACVRARSRASSGRTAPARRRR